MKKKLTNLEFIILISITIKMLGLVYRIFVTRFLNLEGMRIMSLIMPTLGLVLCISSLSSQTVVNQNIAANLANSKTILKSSFRITFISSSIVSIVLLFSFPLYQRIYQNSFIYYPLLLCIPLIYLSNTSGIFKGYLEANNNFLSTYLSNLFENLTKFFLTLILLIIFKDKSVEFLILITFLCLTLSEVSSFLYLLHKVTYKKKINYLNIKTNSYEKNILKQAIPLTLDQLLINLTNYLEPLVFYYALSLRGVNLYDSTIYYTKITSYVIPILIFASFTVYSIAKFAFPKITKNQNSDKLNVIISKAFLACLLISSFNFIVSNIYSEESLLLMYNDVSTSLFLKQLSYCYFFSYFNPIFIIILQALKKEKQLFTISLFTSIIYLIALFFLSYYYSFTGFLISIIIHHLLKSLLLFLYSKKIAKFQISFFKIAIYLIILICYYFVNFVYPNFIFLIISSSIFFLLILYYYRVYNKK